MCSVQPGTADSSVVYIALYTVPVNYYVLIAQTEIRPITIIFQNIQEMESTQHTMVDNKADWCTNGGVRHDWTQWHKFTPVKKYRCERGGCGFFKKCWLKCELADTTCNGCHVIGHKRW